jgi:hypothetical protein
MSKHRGKRKSFSIGDRVVVSSSGVETIGKVVGHVQNGQCDVRFSDDNRLRRVWTSRADLLERRTAWDVLMIDDDELDGMR